MPHPAHHRGCRRDPDHRKRDHRPQTPALTDPRQRHQQSGKGQGAKPGAAHIHWPGKARIVWKNEAADDGRYQREGHRQPEDPMPVGHRQHHTCNRWPCGGGKCDHHRIHPQRPAQLCRGHDQAQQCKVHRDHARCGNPLRHPRGHQNLKRRGRGRGRRHQGIKHQAGDIDPRIADPLR